VDRRDGLKSTTAVVSPSLRDVNVTYASFVPISLRLTSENSEVRAVKLLEVDEEVEDASSFPPHAATNATTPTANAVAAPHGSTVGVRSRSVYDQSRLARSCTSIAVESFDPPR
jgi:hypothetical protein